MGDSKRRMLLLAAVLALAVFAVYVPSLRNGFVNWDDGILVYNNEIVTETSFKSVWRAFTSYDPELYIPLTFLSYQLENLCFGLNPFFFHLTNVLLHMANTLLVFWLFLILIKRNNVAFFCALLWSLHPVNVEAVAWISARKDVLSALFFLASVVSYLKSRENGSRNIYLLSIFLFALALMAKVSVIVLPVILVLFDFYKDRKITLRDVCGKWPYFLLAVVFGIIAIAGKAQNIESLPPFVMALLSVRGTVFYIGKILYPVRLSAFYHAAGDISLAAAEYYMPSIVIIALSAAVLLSWRRTGEAAVWAIFFLVLLTPSFTTFYKVGEIFFASDRYVYLAGIGLVYLVVRFAYAVFRRQALSCVNLAPLVLLLISAAFSFLTIQQSKAWHDTKSLYSSAVKSNPESLFPRHNLGWLELEDGNIDEAIIHLSKAVEIDPSRARAHANLSRAYGKKGMYEEGLKHALKALELDPGKRNEYENALRLLREVEQKP